MTSSISEAGERQLITSFRARNEGSIRALLGRARISTTNTYVRRQQTIVFLDPDLEKAIFSKTAHCKEADRLRSGGAVSLF